MIEAQRWRLISDGAGDPSWNMAIDQAMLQELSSGLQLPVLRFYTWSQSAITIGRFQNVDRTLCLDDIRRLGIPLIRRSTGGRGVLHGGDLTFCIAILKSHLPKTNRSNKDVYQYLQSGLTRTLQKLLGHASRGEDYPLGPSTGNCFAIQSAADLIGPDHSKITGSAMRVYDDRILIQTSIVLRRIVAQEYLMNVFRGSQPIQSYPFSHISCEDFKENVLKSYEEAGCLFVRGELTSRERELANEFALDQFQPINKDVAFEVIDSRNWV
ncbi:MAG: biotin/lipoate A/B protein ligase family protein [Chthonomonadales bacterium]